MINSFTFPIQIHLSKTLKGVYHMKREIKLKLNKRIQSYIQKKK